MSLNRLENIAPDLWVVNSTFKSMGLRGSTRMTIVRLENNRLWVHSPTSVSPELKEQIAALGHVAYVIAPNAMHFLFFEGFLKEFPAAKGYVSPALVKKHRRFKVYAPVQNLSHSILPQLEMQECGGHIIGETLFFHTPSGTLITSDLLYNLQPEHGLFEKSFMKLLGSYGKPCVPCYHRAAVRLPQKLLESLEQVAKWPIKRIIMAHGRILEGEDTGHAFHSAWQWLKPVSA